MKKYLLVIAISVVLPLASFAAYNDVQVSSDGNTTISLNGVSLVVSSGTAAVFESITVSAGGFSVVMPVNSYLRVTLASRRTVTVTNKGTVSLTESCSDSESAYKLENPVGGEQQTVTVDLTNSTCDTASGNGAAIGGGGGGGGGGYSYVTPVTAIPAKPAIPSVSKAVPAISVAPVVRNYVFNKPIVAGSSNSDIKALQQILNSDPDTRIALSGAGSPGNETNFFGSGTLKAVQKFQKKYGLANAGDQGYGTVGPKTRAKLNEIAAGVTGVSGVTPSENVTTPSSATSVSPIISLISRSLSKGISNADVRVLQQVLNSDPDTQVSVSGAGSPGNETTLFGQATVRAVQKFQEKFGIAGPGESGYGSVGPKTRAKLNEIIAERK